MTLALTLETPSSRFQLLPNRPFYLPNQRVLQQGKLIQEMVLRGFLIKGIGTNQFTLIDPKDPIFNTVTLLPFNFMLGKCVEIFFRSLGIQSVSELVSDVEPLSIAPQVDYDAYVQYLKEHMKIKKNPTQISEFLDLLNSYPLEIETKKQIIQGFFSEIAHLFGNSYLYLAQNLNSLSRENQEEVVLLGLVCDISLMRPHSQNMGRPIPSFLKEGFKQETISLPEEISVLGQDSNTRLDLLLKLEERLASLEGPLANEARRYLIQQILDQLEDNDRLLK